MTGRGPLRPRPRAPPGGTAPLPSRCTEGGGGTQRLTAEAAPPIRSLYLPCRPWRGGGSAAAAGLEAGQAERGGRAVPALAVPTPSAAAPSIVSCPRCVRLPAPRTPSRANADQSAPAARRRRPISEGQGAGTAERAVVTWAGSLLEAAIFRSALSALLKGPRPTLRGGGFRFWSRFPVFAPGPGLERTGGCGSSAHHSRGQSESGRDRERVGRGLLPGPPCHHRVSSARY